MQTAVHRLTTALCLSLALAGSLRAGTPLDAVVLDYAGTVILQSYPGGPPIPTLLAQRLPLTANVRAEEGGRLLLLLPGDLIREIRGRFDGVVERFPPRGTVRSPLLSIVQAGLAPLASTNLANYLPQVTEGAGPTLDAPRDRVTPGAVRFYWTSATPEGRHHVRVTDGTGITVFKTEVDGCNFRLPAGVLLPGGLYQWSVVDAQKHRCKPRSFRVLTVEDAAAIELGKSNLARRLQSAPIWVRVFLEACYFEASGLLDLAIARYDEAALEAGKVFPALKLSLHLAHMRLRHSN